MLELLLGGNELVMRGGCQLGRWCLPILKVVLAGKPDLKETESLRALLLAHASMDVKYAHERTHKHAACIYTRAHTQTDTHTPWALMQEAQGDVKGCATPHLQRACERGTGMNEHLALLAWAPTKWHLSIDYIK